MANAQPNGQWYPPEWPERIRALAAGELTPAVARRAATVMLLRDAQDGTGPEVHLLRRRASMAFASGAYAYPGGGVDPRDDELHVRWAGPDRAQWAERLGVAETEAQALVCAAVRETYEEAGVLLAGPEPDSVVDDTTGPDWEADRAALIAHELSFAAFLDRRGLVLRSDLLAAWARWITPEFEPRRYDTFFFVAALPEGQRTLVHGRTAERTEADLSVWLRPEDAVAGHDKGEMAMLPPTLVTLRDLSGHPSAADALSAAAHRDLSPVLAQARVERGEVVLTWPGHDEFTTRIPSGDHAHRPTGGSGS